MIYFNQLIVLVLLLDESLAASLLSHLSTQTEGAHVPYFFYIVFLFFFCEHL